MIFNTHKTTLLKPVFLNSIPKSGTNLLIQALSGVPGLKHEPTATFFNSYEYPMNFYRLGKVRNGNFAVGHIYYSEEWSRMLRRLQMKQIFIMRDLRDILVSLRYFIVDKPQYHTMNQLRTYLLTHASTPIEQIRLLMTGIQDDGFYYPDFKTWISPFSGWLNDSNTLVVRYENLVEAQESRTQVFRSIANYLDDGTWDKKTMSMIVNSMEANVDPRFCGTFRKGVIGDWKIHFEQQDIETFNKIAGTALRDFGYK